MNAFPGFTCGMGLGGWLANYKRFLLPPERMFLLTEGDYEHFETYITQWDVANIRAMGMDHVRLAFDQNVVEEAPGILRNRVVSVMERFLLQCRLQGLHVVFNLHRAFGNLGQANEKKLLEDEGLMSRFVGLWTALETRFSGYPEVAFELLNEVRDVDPALWNQLADRTVSAIRAANPSRILIIGSTDCGNPARLKAIPHRKDLSKIAR